MDARCVVRTTVDPPQVAAQRGKDALHLMPCIGLPNRRPRVPIKNGASSSREAPATPRVQQYWPKALTVLGCSGTWRDGELRGRIVSRPRLRSVVSPRFSDNASDRLRSAAYKSGRTAFH